MRTTILWAQNEAYYFPHNRFLLAYGRRELYKLKKIQHTAPSQGTQRVSDNKHSEMIYGNGCV